MEAFNNYSFKEYNFTLWFFRIVLGIAITIVVLVLVLQINETIGIDEGQIVAVNPQSDFKAPFEAQITGVNVKEGQAVKAGDTLLVMTNADLADQEAKTKTEIEYLQKKIASIAVLQEAVEKRKGAIDQTSAIAAKKYQLDVNKLVNDMRSLDQQYSTQKQRVAAVREKYVADSILYKKDMLSKYEFNTTNETNLSSKQDLTALQTQRNNQLTEKNLVYNNLTREQNTLLLNKVQLDENAQALIQAKNESESQLQSASQTLKKLQAELNKQYIVATTPGIVNHLYNTQLTSNLISKGDLLVSIAPRTISYYAKVFLSEVNMPYIKCGQNAQLKLDAYQRFEQGPIKGKVTYVAERKENDKFYALVQLSASDRFQLKSGFTVNGQIIIQRLPLYKFFIKKLFKRFDQI